MIDAKPDTKIQHKSIKPIIKSSKTTTSLTQFQIPYYISVYSSHLINVWFTLEIIFWKQSESIKGFHL